MVEANTELLGGAAVTVFLAPCFRRRRPLGRSPALRSVGDKIDKLEDNIDDDLTDIAHHLDGMSNARGGGGGTQLHLSGGTISSGPGPNQPQQAPQAGPQQSPQAGPQQAPQAGPQQEQPTADPPDRAGPQSQSHSQQAKQQSAAARRAEEPDEGTTSSETVDPTESPGSDADDPQSDDRADGAADDERSADESATDAEPDADDEPTEHPRAERNRVRFITSPDRTAWYATPLDREAIVAARPTIAGALTDGSDDGIDDSDVIAAGPVGSRAREPRPRRTLLLPRQYRETRPTEKRTMRLTVGKPRTRRPRRPSERTPNRAIGREKTEMRSTTKPTGARGRPRRVPGLTRRPRFALV